jgi:hypothetical protein
MVKKFILLLIFGSTAGLLAGDTTSAAMQRFKVDDSQNEFFTMFRYKPLKGLGYEPGVGRRDPSNVIKVNDLYYVYYTRIEGERPVGVKKATETKRAFKWDLAQIWYATSPDGITWTERGMCVQRGDKGSFDDRSVFTPNVLVAEGKYYLVYQAVKAPYNQRSPNVVAMASATSPDGPWEKFPEPVLETGEGGVWKGDESEMPGHMKWAEAEELGSWDSHKVHDPSFLVREGKYWLYYKGQQIGRHPFDSKWGVAIADKPEGPYVKHPLNPITNSGHEIWVWPYKEGVAAIIDWAGPEKNTIQYAPDGVNFEIVSSILDIPPAGGAYIPDLFTNTSDGQGFSWGLCYIKDDWDYIVRFECDLERGKERDLRTRYKHYGKVFDVSDTKENKRFKRHLNK